MTNLIKADLIRIKRDTALRVIVIIMLALNFISLGFMKLVLPGGMSLDDMAGFDSMLVLTCGSIGNLGLYIAIAASIIVGKDFNFNTIRNKIICGNSRFKIFTSSFITQLIVGFSLFIITFAESILLTLIFFGGLSRVSLIFQSIALAIPLYIAFIAVMTFISMSTRSQTMGIIFNVLIIALIPTMLQFAGLIASMLVLPGESSAFLTILSVIPYNIINTITGDITALIGGGGNVINGVFVAKTLISSAVLGGAAYGFGYLIFRKADIK